MPNPIKIAVADDHDAFRTELVKLLQAHHFLVTCDTKNALFSRTLHPFAVPDIAIINYKTNRPETLDAARWLREVYPQVKIVISTLFSFHLPEETFKQLGISGLFIKTETNVNEIISMLRGLANKESNMQ